jgi:hypothetical protein
MKIMQLGNDVLFDFFFRIGHLGLAEKVRIYWAIRS